VQSKVRQFLARKEFKKLKIEARSIEHQKTLNKGLENKIISLQQRLTESEKSAAELRKLREEHKATIQHLEELRVSETKSKGALGRVEILEQELKELRATLDQERSEKGLRFFFFFFFGPPRALSVRGKVRP
jgi:myosin-5